jgi:hypothetical protein
MWHLLKYLKITKEDWIRATTRTGTINNYKPEYNLGTQPVRVLHQMVVLMFQATNQKFLNEIAELLKVGKLHNELAILYEEAPIIPGNGKPSNTPRVDVATKAIQLHETFLSYMWCIAYAIFVQYIEKIDKPRLNKENGKITHPVLAEEIDKAKEVFEYGTSLIRHFTPWNKEHLPNPEIYEAASRDYPEQTTLYYTEAIKFILSHELAHIKLHIDKIQNSTPESHFVEYEMEADNYAIQAVKAGINFFNRIAVENGVIISILSMLFFRAATTGKKHPSVEDRLTNALEQLAPKDNHEAWGFACIGLQMWEEQFGLNLTWDDSLPTYKDKYYHIVKQIKDRQ